MDVAATLIALAGLTAAVVLAFRSGAMTRLASPAAALSGTGAVELADPNVTRVITTATIYANLPVLAAEFHWPTE